jgi:hypothetical protein
MKSKLIAAVVAVPLIAGLSVPLLRAEQAKPKYTIKEVMKTLHKGDDSIGKKVSQGHGTKADFDKMVEYYAALPQNEPPRGPQDSWMAKTSALLASAKALQAGKPDALEQYKKASNCKACHSEHKPPQDKH